MIQEAILMQTAKPFIDDILKKFILPKFDNFIKSTRIEIKNIFIPKSEHFEEYLYRTYKKYSIVNTLVFKNEQRLIKDLYIPLTITKNDSQKREEEEKTTITKYPENLVAKYKKILITDTAGMGKSTLTKLLFLSVIEDGYGIPIYIEMRRLTDNRTILQEIQEQINSISKDFDSELLLKFIQTGSFIFFLDGYDEIPLKDRAIVTSNIQDFISKASNNTFFMTSRPEQALASFGDFQSFRINPLSKKEAYELLRKYDNQGTTSKPLIEELKSGHYEMINEFLQNPLLVSLLFAAYDYKQTIPLKKHIFYRQVYDAYFDSHDLSKGDGYIHLKKSNLDIDDFERVLRHIGYHCLRQQKIEFEKDQLLQIIDYAKDFCPDLNFSASDFLEDLLTSVPIFCEDGHLIKWVHKSLQEYFAAQFIFKDSKDNQDQILTTIYNSNNLDKYINLLDIYYDIDNWGFTKNIIKPLCIEYKNFYEKNSFTSQILDQKDIDIRIGLIFKKKVLIGKSGNLLDDENPFQLILDLVEKKFGCKDKNRISACFIPSEHYFIAESEEPKCKLLPLIAKRFPIIFLDKSPTHSVHKSFSTDKLRTIDIHTDENKADSFRNINIQLIYGNRNFRQFLDYGSCLTEIKRIKEIEQKKENSLDILEGL